MNKQTILEVLAWIIEGTAIALIWAFSSWQVAIGCTMLQLVVFYLYIIGNMKDPEVNPEIKK